MEEVTMGRPVTLQLARVWCGLKDAAAVGFNDSAMRGSAAVFFFFLAVRC